MWILRYGGTSCFSDVYPAHRVLQGHEAHAAPEILARVHGIPRRHPKAEPAGHAQAILSYTPGGMMRYTRSGCETFLKVRSPRFSNTKKPRMRSAVAGPTTISSP